MGISFHQYQEMLARTERARFESAAPAAGESPELESHLHEQILEYCRGRGHAVVHSRMDKKTTTDLGVPDFIISTPGRVFFIEAKRKCRKATPQQLAFLAQVRKDGHPCGVVYNYEEFLNLINDNTITS